MSGSQIAEVRRCANRAALSTEGERIESVHEKEEASNFRTNRLDWRLDFDGESRCLLQLRQKPHTERTGKFYLSHADVCGAVRSSRANPSKRRGRIQLPDSGRTTNFAIDFYLNSEFNDNVTVDPAGKDWAPSGRDLAGGRADAGFNWLARSIKLTKTNCVTPEQSFIFTTCRVGRSM